MPIPAVNISVIDGALGIVPASAAGVQVKMGACQNATSSVAASKKIASTTSGDGVTFTAKTAGAGGNLISIQYNAPSGGNMTVTVINNAIVVSPKSNATNSDVKTAVDGNAQAAALVSTAVTVGSDLVVTTAQTFLSGGITGTINALFSETNPQQALTDLGYGPLTEAVVHSLNVAGGTVLAMPIATSVSSVTSAVAQSGSGLGTVAVSGTPLDYYLAQIKISLGGATGVAQFQYSLDNGQNFSPVFAVPSGGTFVIPNTGLTLTFSSSGGNFVAGDIYAFSTAPAGSNLTDVTNGINALLALPNAWGWIHVVAPAQTAAGAATLAAGVETLLEGAASTNFKYGFVVVECPTDTDANIESAFASFSGTRTMVCVGTENLTSSVLGDVPIRGSAWPVTARMAKIPPSEDIGWVGRGSLPGVTALQRDEYATPALDALNFTTLRTIPGLTGFFATGGHMFASVTSDYSLAQNRRVMDVACTAARTALLPFLNATIVVNKKDGTISNAQATLIENTVGAALAAVLVSPGDAVAASIVVDRTNNVLSSKTLNVSIRVTPNGYAKQISVTLGFFNPALSPQ